MRRYAVSTMLLMMLSGAGSGAIAQSDFPSKPMRLIVGFTAGGISDVLGRALAAKLSLNINQQVVVENKPGAGTTIAGEFTAKSPPDGYTLFLQDITTHAINASLYSKLPYDSVKDFSPVALVASTPLMLVVHPSTPANSVKELIAVLKASPGKYSYGSSGNGTILHLTGELFKSVTGLDVLHVPYKGSAPATQAILGKEVEFVFSTMPPAISHVKSGRLRALAVTTPARVATAPEISTMMEAGVPNFEIVLYSGVLGPAGMPAAVVRRLNAEFAKVIASPEIREVYARLGADPIQATPEQFGARIADDIAKFGPVVKASGAKVD
ncbi:MAG: tripartite tricarboxylate transporter substrate binding protein [Betaproteobacteria bacterium]|nr:tripartite tricarboxylate transporter substrate binding protein [Betaproteobacteria bacterium]